MNYFEKLSQDTHDLGAALIDYVQDQVQTNHPELKLDTQIAMGGLAAIGAGLSLMIGGLGIPRDELMTLLNGKMDAGYKALNKRKH